MAYQSKICDPHAKLTIIQCYPPTNDQEGSNKDEFYQQLQDLVDEVLRHDIKIVMGDVNANIGGSGSEFENAVGPHAYVR